ncbi:unnamed protein product [Ascophyllum nodosum]
MNRRSTNEKTTFTATTAAYNNEVQAALSNRRAEMDSEWDTLDQSWKELERRMDAIGVTKPVVLEACVARLNVGGLPINVRPSQLKLVTHNNTTEWALTTLCDGGWDSRVPRDKDGRIFLDESPTILRHLFNQQLKRASATSPTSAVLRDVTCPNSIASDQLSYLSHVSNDVGFKIMQVLGGSTVLTESELQRFSVQVRSWCPGDPQRLELLYRGSRDGFTTHAFHAKCTDESPSTITLVKVDHGGGGSGSSVVGGFSSVSWVPTSNNLRFIDGHGNDLSYGKKDSPHAFVFMAKDGSAKEGQEYQPVRWILPRISTGYPAVDCDEKFGPDFGIGGFGVRGSTFKLIFDRNTANITGDKASQFVQLDNKKVSELEVYRVCSDLAAPAVSDLSGITEAVAAEHVVNDRLFGASIAGVFMEERILLNDAQAELKLAERRVKAATYALTVMYGPDIASGKSDPVVELNVHGTRATTLRSTLQACPESALAARFDETKWPSDGKDFGVIDCRPSSFSKVLDVLRMRKRAGWYPGDPQEKVVDVNTGRVTISTCDRESFEEFVRMYFPGCEGFVMDVVEFQGS